MSEIIGFLRKIPDHLAHKEKRVLLVTHQESVGVSNRGGRPHGPDEDSLYSSSRGFCLGEMGGTDAKRATPDERIDGLAEALNGLQIKDAKGRVIETIQITRDDFVRTHQTIEKQIHEGILAGINVVCDGMGGYGAGEFASSIATYMFVSAIAQLKGNITVENIRTAVLKAHNTVASYNEKYNKNAGTTFVAQVTGKDGKTIITSVGDARVYKIDNYDDVRRVTQDQSRVEYFLQNMEIKPSEAFSHPQRAVIRKTLGGKGTYESTLGDIQVYQDTLKPGERYVLCCDGVWEGIDVTNPDVKAALEAVDTQFDLDISRNMPISEALNLAYGRIFKINLSGVAQNATLNQLANHLTRGEVGTFSRDNVSAVVVENKEALLLQLENQSVTLNIGARVNVPRSSGEIDDDWVVVGLDAEGISVKEVKEENGTRTTSSKHISQTEFRQLNQFKIDSTLESVGTFGDLSEFLDQFPSWQGSQETFTISKVKELIIAVRQGKYPITAITSQGGLRQKVQELMEKVKQK